jgi:holo-[acyl-carrier protein] synthase
VKVGVDLIEIERIRRALERPGFRERCFTEAERAYCDSRADPAQSYAARFAGKEAVGKALGCGVRFTWKEVEIVGRPKPRVRLSGRTAAFAERVRAGAIDLSLTHSRELAAAIAVIVPLSPVPPPVSDTGLVADSDTS